MNILWAAAAKKEITITSVAVVLHPYGIHIESTILVAGLTVAAVLLIEKQCTLEARAISDNDALLSRSAIMKARSFCRSKAEFPGFR